MIVNIDKNKDKYDLENLKVGDGIATSCYSGFGSGSSGYGIAEVVTKITDTEIVTDEGVYDKEEYHDLSNSIYYISCYWAPEDFHDETIEWAPEPTVEYTEEEKKQREQDFINAYYEEMKHGIIKEEVTNG
jgi:hypothetical protein